MENVLSDHVGSESRKGEGGLFTIGLKTPYSEVIRPDSARGLGGEETAGGRSVQGGSTIQHLLDVLVVRETPREASGQGEGGGSRREYRQIRGHNSLLMVYSEIKNDFHSESSERIKDEKKNMYK